MSTLPHLTKTYGGISHSLCIAYFCSLNYVVSLPMFDNARYDLLIDDGNSIKRVQCKTAKIYEKSKLPRYNRVRLGHGSQKNYLPTDFDLLWITTNQSAYLIPVNDIPITQDEKLVGISLTPKYNTYIVDMPFLNTPDPLRRLSTPSLTDIEKERVESLFILGESAKSIALTMGLTQDHVEGFLYSNGIKRDHTLKPEVREKIVSLYSSGAPINDIIKDVGFSRAAIQTVIKEHGGVSRRRIVLSPDIKSEIVKMYASGKSVQEIAAFFNVKRTNTISTFLSRHQWLVEEARAKLANSPIALA